MKPELTVLKQSIAIRTEYVATEHPTTLRVKQGDGTSAGKFTISYDHESISNPSNSSSSPTLFTVSGKSLSPSLRRSFFDASGLPLFDLSRKSASYTWHISLPGQELGQSMARLSPRWNNLKDKIYIDIDNAVAQGDKVYLEALGQDVWKLRTNVYVGENVVMTVKRKDKLTPYLLVKGNEWVVDVAEGMDLALASAIVVVLAATMYDTSMGSSMSQSKDEFLAAGNDGKER